MIRKLFVSALVSVSAAAGVFAQQTGVPVERQMSRTILSAPFGGSYLGVQSEEITKENFAKYGLREVRGVGVGEVIKDSPAERAGLKTGDVIVRFGGEEVTSVNKLTRLINEVAPDHEARITILRGGSSEQDLTATLGKRKTAQFQGAFDSQGGFYPEMTPFPRVPQTPRVPLPPMSGFDGNNAFTFFNNAASRQIGVGATPLTKQLGDYFGVAGGEGLLISSVRENSPAARAGLKAGDIVTEVDGKAVKTNVDLIRAVGDKKEGDVTLTIVRDKNRQTIRVTPEAAKAAPALFQYFDGNNLQEIQKQLNNLQQLQKQPQSN
ncbi:MAG: PDZ domain-containing protein [Acidobacteria bacterium]|nr:PDZ domain-containing protein [Acidobacteriota bacterium]